MSAQSSLLRHVRRLLDTHTCGDIASGAQTGASVVPAVLGRRLSVLRSTVVNEAIDPWTISIPDDEQDRLAALHDLGVLDTEAERAYDEIVQLAAAVSRTPVALISFVDSDRQWFKAKHGWTISGTSREVAICAHTIVSDEHLVIEDTAAHDRFQGHPLVVDDPRIRFYAGVPLRVARDGVTDGRPASAVGTLCVLDVEPHSFDESDLAALQTLAHQVERLLEARLHAAEHQRLQTAKAALRERFNVITESMLCGVVVHRLDGAIESANRAAERILGLTTDQMRGVTPVDPMWRCVRPDGTEFPGTEHPASVTLRDGTAVTDVVMGVSADGDATRWIVVTSSPLFDGQCQLDGAVATFVDITNEVELRERLEQSLIRLRQNTHEQAALTAAITHDLAAPAAALRIVADLLVNGLDGPAGLEALAALQDNAHRVEDLVADLGQLVSRLRESPRPARASTNIMMVVRRTCARAPGPVEIRSHTSRIDADVDEVQIERIVDNLLDNAVKYAPGGGPVVVSVDHDEASVLIVVEDDGPGISPEHRELVFEPFRRINADPTTPGSGIGLYLVRQFARFHDGDAWCESAASGGARLVVRIARVAAAPPTG